MNPSHGFLFQELYKDGLLGWHSVQFVAEPGGFRTLDRIMFECYSRTASNPNIWIVRHSSSSMSWR